MRSLKWTGLALLSLLIVFVVARYSWLSIKQNRHFYDFEGTAAAFGDIAGVVFSALAFAGLIITALMQSEELSMQRTELKETRDVLKETAASQAASVEALKEQTEIAKEQTKAAQEQTKAAQEQVETAQLTARLNAATVLLSLNKEELGQPFRKEGGDEIGMESERSKSELLKERDGLKAEIATLKSSMRATLNVSAAVSGGSRAGAESHVASPENRP